jgi:hypothetical protein
MECGGSDAAMAQPKRDEGHPIPLPPINVEVEMTSTRTPATAAN